MTIMDMVCLADLWINLSEPAPGMLVQQVVLPGVLTGREEDRYFRCGLRSTLSAWDKNSDWGEYVRQAVDHVDFVEVKEMLRPC